MDTARGDGLPLRDEKGLILITMLLLMVVISLIGVIAVNTSMVDIQISGNLRKGALAFQGAEAGVDLSIGIIENTILNGSLTPSAPVGVISSLDTSNLGTEIMGGDDYNSDGPDSSPDVGIDDLNGVTVTTDIDRLYSYQIPGGAAPFAMGYEGIGAGAGRGGTGVLYRIDSEATM